MEEESNIRKAQPKQGLETGSLEGAKGGLSPKQTVARAYEADLAGNNGPEARFDALTELIGTKIKEANNAMVFSSPGGTQIFGRDGKFSITQTGRRGGRSLRREVPVVKSNLGPWALIPSGDPGEFVVNVGSVLKSGDSVSQVLTCSNPSETYSVEADQIFAVKITSEEPTSYEVVLLNAWPEADGYQVSYTGSMGGEDFAFVERHYPLWQFVATATATSIPLGEGLHGEQLCFNHLQIQYGIYRTPDGEFVQLPGFAISHRAL
jgi:hypothetical protein